MDLRAAKADWKRWVLCLHQNKNVVQKKNGVAWSWLLAHLDSLSTAGLSLLLVTPSHGLFSKVVFPGHLKKWQSFLNARKVTQPKRFWLTLAVSIFSSTNAINRYPLEPSHRIVVRIKWDNVCEGALQIGNLFMEVRLLYCSLSFNQTLQISSKFEGKFETFPLFLNPLRFFSPFNFTWGVKLLNYCPGSYWSWNFNIDISKISWTTLCEILYPWNFYSIPHWERPENMKLFSENGKISEDSSLSLCMLQTF